MFLYCWTSWKSGHVDLLFFTFFYHLYTAFWNSQCWFPRAQDQITAFQSCAGACSNFFSFGYAGHQTYHKRILLWEVFKAFNEIKIPSDWSIVLLTMKVTWGPIYRNQAMLCGFPISISFLSGLLKGRKII